MIEPRLYRLRTPPAERHPECVLVTADNMAEVAEWADGKVDDFGEGPCVVGLGSLAGPVEIRAYPGMMLCKRPGDFFLYARSAASFGAEFVAVGDG